MERVERILLKLPSVLSVKIHANPPRFVYELRTTKVLEIIDFEKIIKTMEESGFNYLAIYDYCNSIALVFERTFDPDESHLEYLLNLFDHLEPLIEITPNSIKLTTRLLTQEEINSVLENLKKLGYRCVEVHDVELGSKKLTRFKIKP